MQECSARRSQTNFLDGANEGVVHEGAKNDTPSTSTCIWGIRPGISSQPNIESAECLELP